MGRELNGRSMGTSIWEGLTPLKSRYADVHLSTGHLCNPVCVRFYKVKNAFLCTFAFGCLMLAGNANLQQRKDPRIMLNSMVQCLFTLSLEL